jgi:NAD(P)-dependent dehydrogenase (short-subunit alcohol dehydrogenase family)
MRLKDKVAIVTGAASGMGAATARIFADEGAKVVVTDLDVKAGAAVTDAIVDTGCEARFLKLDIANEEDWRHVVSETVASYGQIDILINNAGISGSHPDQLNTTTWDEQMNIYAKGAFLGMQAVIPVMQKAGRGSIVNISSISAFVGQAYVHMGYNAAKAAVRVATKSAAVQFANDGIRVNSVHPGIIRLNVRVALRKSPMRTCFWPVTKRPTSPASSCLWTAVIWPFKVIVEYHHCTVVRPAHKDNAVKWSNSRQGHREYELWSPATKQRNGQGRI